jgi:phosphoserine phosphatase
MTENTAQSEQFTGLILLTGNDNPGIAASLFETLAPFAVHVIDIEQVVINNRLILTVLIGANPAHQGAIEEDLNSCALSLDVDIATLFSKGHLPPIARNLIEVYITSAKLHPKVVASVSQAITDSGGNIQRVVRTSADPVSICISISEVTKDNIGAALSSLAFEDDTTVTVNEI